MRKYQANWQDKQTLIIRFEKQLISSITFEKTDMLAFGNAIIEADGNQYRIEQNGLNFPVYEADREIFTAVSDPLWGNLQLRLDNNDTGYDIKGKWFKLGTRLTDADDNDLVVVKSEFWAGRDMEIEVADVDISDLMVAATLYHHVRSSAAKTVHTLIS